MECAGRHEQPHGAGSGNSRGICRRQPTKKPAGGKAPSGHRFRSGARTRRRAPREAKRVEHAQAKGKGNDRPCEVPAMGRGMRVAHPPSVPAGENRASGSRQRGRDPTADPERQERTRPARSQAVRPRSVTGARQRAGAKRPSTQTN